MIKKSHLLSLIAVILASSSLLSSCSKLKTNTTQDDNSKPKVANSAEIPTYVFYYAQWCGYCHKMAPHVKKAAELFHNKVYFYYVDIDSEEGKEFSKKYRPEGRGVPFAQYYDAKGNFVNQKIGLISYQELTKTLEKLL